MNSRLFRITLITAIAVISLLGLVYYFGDGGVHSDGLAQRRQSVSEEQHEPAVSPEVSTKSVEQKILDSPLPQTEDETLSALSERFFEVQSASEAQEVISELYLLGYLEQAQEFELLLSGVCTQYSTLTKIPNRKDLANILDSYCGSFEATEDEFVNIVATSSVKYQNDLKTIRDAFKALPSEEGSKRLNLAIEGADSWHDLEIIKNMILLSGADRYSNNFSFDLGQDRWLAGDQARQIQAAALTLLQCEQYGAGCRAGNLRTYEHCLLNGHCEQGWSLADYYRNTLSVLEAEQLDQILYYLRGLRPDN